MAIKKDNLPLTMDTDTEQTSSITYANEVVAIIAGVAAGEVEGIAGMCNISGSILSKNRNITRGVKVEIGTEEASVDLYVIIEYGTPIQKAAQDAQENVRKAIESMTGLHVVRVDVHVQGVSFEKENNALAAGQEKAVLEAGTSVPKVEAAPVAQEPAPQEPASVAEDSSVVEAAAGEAADQPSANDTEPVSDEQTTDEAAPETEA